MHSGRIILALASHFDWWRNKMMTEYYVDGGQADLIFISQAGYLTEIEVKVSRADWKHDLTKDKWRKPRPHVARFFYAVPEKLAADIPEWVPAEAGILAVIEREWSDHIKEIRPAKRRKALKIDDRMRRHIDERCYGRFWGHYLDGMRNRRGRIEHTD